MLEELSYYLGLRAATPFRLERKTNMTTTIKSEIKDLSDKILLFCIYYDLYPFAMEQFIPEPNTEVEREIGIDLLIGEFGGKHLSCDTSESLETKKELREKGYKTREAYYAEKKSELIFSLQDLFSKSKKINADPFSFGLRVLNERFVSFVDNRTSSMKHLKCDINDFLDRLNDFAKSKDVDEDIMIGNICLGKAMDSSRFCESLVCKTQGRRILDSNIQLEALCLREYFWAIMKMHESAFTSSCSTDIKSLVDQSSNI